MKSYLITGGTGFIGRAVIRALLSKGFKVRVLDDNSRGNLDSLKDILHDFEFINADIRDTQKVKKACQRIDAVIHLASINGTRYFYSIPEVVLDVSTRGMINIIDACLWHGVEELFFASSSEVYHIPPKVPTSENVPMVIPDPFNPRFSYAGGKIISELLTLNYGRQYFKKAIIFRPHNVYGPEMGWEHVIPQFMIRMRRLIPSGRGKIKFPIQGSGRETRSFVFIDDFVDGLMLLLEAGRHLEIYNVGTTEEIQIRELARLVAKYFKKDIVIVPGKLASGGTPRRLPDISKITKLGYRPKVNLKKGIAITAQWYNDNAHKLPSFEII